MSFFLVLFQSPLQIKKPNIIHILSASTLRIPDREGHKNVINRKVILFVATISDFSQIS